MIYVLRADLKYGAYAPEEPVSRTVVTGDGASLDDLCQTLMKSVDFDMEHPYRFDMLAPFYEKNYYSKDPAAGEKSTKEKLSSLGLKSGQVFYLVYDYEDEWTFTLSVLETKEGDGDLPPAATEGTGEVEQYRDRYWSDAWGKEAPDEEDLDGEEQGGGGLRDENPGEEERGGEGLCDEELRDEDLGNEGQEDGTQGDESPDDEALDDAGPDGKAPDGEAPDDDGSPDGEAPDDEDSDNEDLDDEDLDDEDLDDEDWDDEDLDDEDWDDEDLDDEDWDDEDWDDEDLDDEDWDDEDWDDEDWDDEDWDDEDLDDEDWDDEDWDDDDLDDEDWDDEDLDDGDFDEDPDEKSMDAERNWGFIRGNRYGSIYDRGPDLFVMEELPSGNEAGKGRKNGKILDFPAAGRNKKKQKGSRNEKNGSDTGTGDIIPFFLRDKSLDFSREFFEEDLDDDETEDLLARRILLRLVENQLEKKDPPFVSEAYAALQKKGYLKKQAKIRLTEALALELVEEDKTGKPDFSLERYAGFVEKAAAEPGDPEEIPDLETGRERQIRKQLEEFEDAYDESDDDLAADIFTEIWPDIKADAEDNYTRETDSGTEKSTVYDIDALQDFRLNLAENIEETADIFQGCRRYLDGVRIFQEILDTFAWEDGDDDDLRGNLSWFYEEAGMPEEAEKILKDWYETSPDNPVCTYYYVELYRNRKDLQQARRILEEHLPKQQAVDENSVDLYHSAAELYQELGEPEKAEHYQKLADHLEDSVRKFFNKEMQMLAEALQDDWDITPDFWKDEE